MQPCEVKIDAFTRMWGIKQAMNQTTNGTHTDRRKLPERRILPDRRWLPNRRLNLLKPGKRSDKLRVEESEELHWPANTKNAYHTTHREFRDSLYAESSRIAKAQQSSTVTDANVRQANENLLLGKQQPEEMRGVRIACIVLVIVGTLITDTGIEDHSTFSIVTGVTIVTALMILQDQLFRHKR